MLCTCFQRRGAFIEEVEEEERRKALLASSGPMTLTSLMSKQKKEGKSGLVYVNVGSLESEDVFVSSPQGQGQGEIEGWEGVWQRQVGSTLDKVGTADDVVVVARVPQPITLGVTCNCTLTKCIQEGWEDCACYIVFYYPTTVYLHFCRVDDADMQRAYNG